jgi:hypothetical protein
MIKKANFEKFEPIILDAVDELFQHCIKKEIRPNEFLIFLENGHVNNALEENSRFSKYVIGQGEEGINDADRMAFVEWFLSIPFEKRYALAKNLQEKHDIRKISTSLSMMVYTHFWESKVFQRTLRLLALLSEGKDYDWELVCRPKKTYGFIRDNIRNVFQAQRLKIYDIIKKCYRSQVRNAFAHSDYHLTHDRVYLDNYNPQEEHSIKYLKNEEFDELIIMTILIHHCITIKVDEYREKLGKENPDREIFIPENGGENRKIHYRQTGSIYRWLWPNQI